MKRIPDNDLLHQLQYASRRELDPVFSYLYRRMYDQINLLVTDYKGTEQDAEDIFQDGLLALLKICRRGRLAVDVNVEAYLFTICRNQWLKQLKKRKELISLSEMQLTAPKEDSPMYQLMKKEEQKELMQLLQKINGACCQVLSYYYFDRLRLSEIARRMGYASEQVAKNKKSKCMKKLRALCTRLL